MLICSYSEKAKKYSIWVCICVLQYGTECVSLSCLCVEKERKASNYVWMCECIFVCVKCVHVCAIFFIIIFWHQITTFTTIHCRKRVRGKTLIPFHFSMLLYFWCRACASSYCSFRVHCRRRIVIVFVSITFFLFNYK